MPDDADDKPSEAAQGHEDETQQNDEPETFPRDYVEKLRKENADMRVRAKRADDLQARLLDATIALATQGLLADPSDLPRTDDLLDDDGYPSVDKITAAAHDLTARKPHLALRRPSGDIDQGARQEPQTVTLAEILRERAG